MQHVYLLSMPKKKERTQKDNSQETEIQTTDEEIEKYLHELKQDFEAIDEIHAKAVKAVKKRQETLNKIADQQAAEAMDQAEEG